MTRVGVIGVGAIAQVHLDAWRQIPVDLVGYYDIDPGASAWAAEKYGGTAFETLGDLLANVDMVDVCTPGADHVQPVLDSAAAGKAIICEKPLARTVADCRTMIDACEAAGVPLYVAHVVRFFPEFAVAKEQLAAGAIGQPAVMRTVRAGGGEFHSDYYGDFKRSGGVILDVGIHDIDYQRWCFGEVERVFARGKTFDGNPRNDHALILLRYKNGAMGHIQCSWAHPSGIFRTRLELAGTDGLIEWDSMDTPSLTLQKRSADDTGVEESGQSPTTTEAFPYYAELAHFVECYEQGVPAEVSATDTLMAVKISLAAIESMRCGKPIDIASFEES